MTANVGDKQGTSQWVVDPQPTATNAPVAPFANHSAGETKAESGGTDLAAAIDAVLAKIGRGNRHQILISSDPGAGNTETIIAAAKAAGVPVAVIGVHANTQFSELVDAIQASKK